MIHTFQAGSLDDLQVPQSRHNFIFDPYRQWANPHLIDTRLGSGQRQGLED